MAVWLLNQQSANTGFTLLELMVVIAITAILTTMSVVQFSRVSRATQLRLATENLVSYIRATESMSRSGLPLEESQRIDCNGDGSVELSPCGGYGVEIRNDRYIRFGDNSKTISATGNPLVETVTLASNIRISSNTMPVSVVFVPPKDRICISDGSASPPKCFPDRTLPQTAEVVMTVSIDNGALTNKIRINNVSGLVSIE